MKTVRFILNSRFNFILLLSTNLIQCVKCVDTIYWINVNVSGFQESAGTHHCVLHLWGRGDEAEGKCWVVARSPAGRWGWTAASLASSWWERTCLLVGNTHTRTGKNTWMHAQGRKIWLIYYSNSRCLILSGAIRKGQDERNFCVVSHIKK